MASRPDHLSRETELAKHVVAHFQADNWEVYQEVKFFGSIADIVVTRQHLIGVIECKQALGLPVLEQAYYWVKYANFVWAAFWYKARGRSSFACRIASDYGLGLLEVSTHGVNGCGHRSGEAEFRRRLAKSPLLREALRPEHKTGYALAGSNRGGHFTPFAETCRNLKRVAGAKPGIGFGAAIKEISHHYASTSSARASLKKWIESGKVLGVRLEMRGRRLVLMPDEKRGTGT